MMKNEISRKLTSITLMGIMVAGGITFAIPGEVPQAAAQSSILYVSAMDSPHTGNVFGGPQVIQIVVDDPDKSERGASDPTVTVSVDGTDVNLNQAASGKWYGYIAVKSAD